MSDLAERVRSIGEHMDAGYGPERTTAALVCLHAGLRRRRARRVALGSLAGLLCLLAGTFWALRPGHETAMPVTRIRPEVPFSLSDGSVMTPLGPNSRLVAKTISPHLVELELVAGSAHFDVTPNQERKFRVSAGRVAVLVLGTRFTVTRQGERSQVEVERGRVRVDWERGQQILDPGERGSFPPVETARAPFPEREAPTLQPPPVPAPAPVEVDWRALAQRGDFHAAYRMMRKKARPAGLSEMDDLLLAADVARSSGHAAEAVPYLEKALVLHQSDARAAVAAFTLGRVRLADLNDPAGAAVAFSRARMVAPTGPLAEDALAREVEACFRAGDKARARVLAEEYVKTWPSGSRVRAVRHFGGIP
jgi:transmembrane sensor